MDKVVHFEIPVADVERAKKFYRKVFDWQLEEYPGMRYTICRTVPVDEKFMPKEIGAINGGMFEPIEKMKDIKHPVITINVASIEHSAKKLEQAGGKMIKEKFAVGGMGFAAYFQDSEGNILGLWETIRK